MKKGKDSKDSKRQNSSKKSFALSGAIKDLNEEIQKASREKSALKKNLENISGAINVDRSKEKELQERIAKLIQREASLNERKKKLESDIDRVSEKINKVSKIRAEMKDI